MNRLKEDISLWQSWNRKTEDLQVLLEMAEEESDESVLTEISAGIRDLNRDLDRWELQQLLSEPYDKESAILSINAGTGGVDAMDWAQMLLRMYTRWAENHKYKVELADLSPAEEAGIKSATLIVTGSYAYGYLKAEKGVHRLVRISPFNAQAKRQTSFASVEVTPLISEEIKIEVRPEDLSIDTFRSGGAGGQNVNKVETAIRITHLPSGIVVKCQSERSQHQNKDIAMKILKAKLYERQQEEQARKLAEVKGGYTEASWGNQIRSYVFQPYQMVKDHRTDFEKGDVQSVMDGELDEFMEAYLKDRAKARSLQKA